MRNAWLPWVTVAVPVMIAGGCASYPDEAATRQTAEQMVKDAYPGLKPEFRNRLVQDESQQICSRSGHAAPSQADSVEVVKAAKQSIKYPASGKLVGDWKIGAKLAYSGKGGRIRGGKLEKGKPGLCSNCHVLDPKEVNSGTLGPSLAGFGTQRGNSAATVKYAYEKIYNAWAYVPCSNMPRLGANGILTPEQITHMVAYLTDPRSPVNRK